MNFLSNWWALLAPAWCMAALLGFLSAPLGCLMLWRKMSFFADTLAHGTLLGIALAVLLHLPFWLGMGFTSLLLVFILWFLADKRLPMDALLALCSSTLLCLGLLVLSKIPALNSSLMGFLFGDILLVQWQNLWVVAGMVLIAGLVMHWHWQAQIKVAFNSEIADCEGVNVRVQRLILMLLLALFTVVALRVVGALLMGALLVIPALTARLLAVSPKSMVWLAWVFCQVGIAMGLLGSAVFDIASGPAIVVMMALMFAVVFVVQKIVQGRYQQQAL